MSLGATLAVLAVMSLLALCLLFTIVLYFSYGAMPWNPKQNKIVGILQAAIAALFGILLVVYYALTGMMDIWYALIVVPVFLLMSWDKLRRARNKK